MSLVLLYWTHSARRKVRRSLIRNLPLGTMDICNKFNRNPSISLEISQNTTNINLQVALKESQGITKVSRIPPLGTINVCTIFCANPCNCCWDIWTKWWADWQTDRVIPRAMPQVWLKRQQELILLIKKTVTCTFISSPSNFWTRIQYYSMSSAGCDLQPTASFRTPLSTDASCYLFNDVDKDC